MAKGWIQNAKIKKGALTKTAKRMGGLKKGNGIKTSFLKKLSKSGTPLQRKRANLALTFKSMRHKKK